MIVRPEEFVPAREASRSLGKLIDRLEAGELEKAVVVDRNTPRVVILTVAQYEKYEKLRELAG